MTEIIEYDYGFKALSPDGCTYRNGKEHRYLVPRGDEVWGPMNVHPDPAKPDGMDCGPGRLHVHNKPTYEYGPPQCWLWLARYPKSAIVGASSQKTGVTQLQLCRIPRKTFYHMIRRGLLEGANLEGANLEGANLRTADLYSANLYRANLEDANLEGANLEGANLEGANLRTANLEGANLRTADLYSANLYRANLEGANLEDANLYRANLRGAYLDKYSILPNGDHWAEGVDMTQFTGGAS